MNNELLSTLEGLGRKASEITHGLKGYGKGSMGEGIRAMCMEAFQDGKKEGIMEG